MLKKKNINKYTWGLLIPIPIVFLAIALYTLPLLLEIIQPNPLSVILKEDPELRQSVLQFSIGAVYTYGLIIGGWFLGLITRELIVRTQYAVQRYQTSRRRKTRS
jgi:hypothetical protein